jgi:hypothetical protein
MVYGIEKSSNTCLGIKASLVFGIVPVGTILMVLLNVLLPSNEHLVFFPNIKHLTHKRAQVEIRGDFCFKCIIGIMPKRGPSYKNGIKNIFKVALIVIDGHIQNQVSFKLSIDKCILKFLPINHENELKGKRNQATKLNSNSSLAF